MHTWLYIDIKQITQAFVFLNLIVYQYNNNSDMA